MKKIHLQIGIALFGLVSSTAFAQLQNKDVLDTVIERYKSAAGLWAETMTGYASYLFWGLALLSMVITFGFMALKRADPMEFFAEFFKFSLNTGFFWWILVNGPAFATSIIDSLRKAGGTAANVPGLGPSGIVDIGIEIFFTLIDKSSIWSPVDSLIGIVLGVAILLSLTLIATNMLLMLISGWILAYGGVFFLGFGGARWTSEMAISYYKTALGLGAAVMGMTLITGVGQALINEFYQAMGKGLNLKEMTVMAIVAVVMLKLANTVPNMLAGMAGGNIASSAASVGLGSMVGAAAVAGGAIATGGALAASAATGMAGGASALKAAFTAAQENMANGTGMFAGGEGAGGGAMSLAQAMGGAQSEGGAGGSLGDVSNAASSTVGGATASGGAASGEQGAGANTGAEANGDSGSSPAAEPTQPGGSSESGNQESNPGANSDGAGQGQNTEGAKKPGLLRTGGLFAADMGKNLARGIGKVATDKAKENLASVKEAISNTAGGQVAAAITANTLAAKNDTAEDTLSEGDQEAAPQSDAPEEIAKLSDEAAQEIDAFVNKTA